jgi:hypothetical protein
LTAATIAHAFRPTIFSRERRFALGPSALEIDDGGAPRAIPYADVAALRIYRQPGGGFGPAIRRTVLSLASGATVVLQNTHYLGFAQIEDRTDSYRALVGALLERVLHANPLARVVVGHSRLAWSVWVALLAATLAVFALGFVVLWRGDFPVMALLYLGIVGAFVPVMWRVVRDSRPREADPRALPAGILD